MNVEAGSGLSVRAMLAELRRRARDVGHCLVIEELDDATYLTVHHFADGATLCYCGHASRPSA